ncbi:MAG: hypothetical protein AAF732_17925 [Pseudomonadota bacterium]
MRRPLVMEVTARHPSGSIFGADGYHHQIAANVWASAGKLPRRPDIAGLAALTLRAEVATPKPLTPPSGVSVTREPKGNLRYID